MPFLQFRKQYQLLALLAQFAIEMLISNLFVNCYRSFKIIFVVIYLLSSERFVHCTLAVRALLSFSAMLLYPSQPSIMCFKCSLFETGEIFAGKLSKQHCQWSRLCSICIQHDCNLLHIASRLIYQGVPCP